VGTNGAILPPQVYWKSMLPNTPMPKAITNLLQSGQYHTLKLMCVYIYIYICQPLIIILYKDGILLPSLKYLYLGFILCTLLM
jgi:hypothetical protein